MKWLKSNGIEVTKYFTVEVGFGFKKKHNFDLGSSISSVLVECKSHKWTEGDKVPSAKLTVWNEAMLYFLLAPATFRKMLFVLKHHSTSRDETLASHYVRTYKHLIPIDVEIWEFDELTKSAIKVTN
jgi:hypothetical protein